MPQVIPHGVSERPNGSNADEWHLFLCEYLDNRATSVNGLAFVAVQIAEAIDAAKGHTALRRIRAICVDATYATRWETIRDIHAITLEADPCPK